MTYLVHIIIVYKFLVAGLFLTTDTKFQKIETYTYKNKPVVVYKNSNNSEVLYKIVLFSDLSLEKIQQTLLVRKADETVKILIGANYILSEQPCGGNYINYPYGWESTNISLKDLKEDCINIFSKNVNPLKMD